MAKADLLPGMQISGQLPTGCPRHSNEYFVRDTIADFSPFPGIALTYPGNECHGRNKNLLSNYSDNSNPYSPYLLFYYPYIYQKPPLLIPYLPGTGQGRGRLPILRFSCRTIFSFSE